MTLDSTIEINSLTKQFGTVRAVDELSFTVNPGRVTGFLGPNGSGKTTTLRMLLGLMNPTSGQALIGGKTYEQLQQPGQVVGAALEASSFHPGRTGLDHLRVHTPQVGVPDARAHELLEFVGLAEAKNRRVGGYSMGMRQRLALAFAMLGDPSVIVLDEPANGLDPQGIAWLRQLLRAFASQGKTVLISSHMLTEVQHTVDDVIVIARGRKVHASSLADLSRLATQNVTVDGPDRARILQLVQSNHWSYQESNRGIVVANVNGAEVGARAFAAGVELHQITDAATPLEDVFLKLTTETQAPASLGGVA